MKSTKPWFGLAWLLALGLALASGALHAADALLPPQQVIQETSDQMQKTLQRPEYKKDFLKATQFVETVLEAHVDFDRVAVLILGKYWKTATPEQQVRFKKEFKLLLVRTYTTAFTEYANWTIRYLPLKSEEGDKRVVVRTEIIQPGAQPVGVNYRMVNQKGDWKVYDVLIEGVSLVQNYRTSFTNDIARTGSLDQLIAQLSQRNSSALKEPVKPQKS
ncbi:phospholipid-binding protein MlaC [Methylococcus sp. EFPC2]|uniref:MlaC/ttg2D family ABC transporter substrate-binding protein n=1 Tax=Methylococcus sp. EFPC2 TaxID=2812648 RepID=UPI001966EBB9|nr:ABC transporter substrate-binding protein [Methylococcus sp. EFPC2]QSA96276.1 ABC transporter substrate-binding protein [Methylococcus sp. EFPC2]